MIYYGNENNIFEFNDDFNELLYLFLLFLLKLNVT